MRQTGDVADPSVPPASQPIWSPWRLTGLGLALVLAMGIGPFVVHTVALLAPIVRDELHLSRAQIGALSAAQFLSATVASSLVGGITDRVGGRRMIGVLFVLVASCLALMATVPIYPVLLVALFVSGIPMAGSNPATNLLVARLVAPGKQGFMLGVKQSGVTVCTMLAGLTLPPIAELVGWRMALLTGAVLSAVGILVLYRVVPADVRPAPGRRPDIGRRHYRGIRWLAAYAFFMGCGGAVATVYLPLYAVESVGMSVQAAGLLAATAALLAVAARVIWGVVTDRLHSPLLPLLALSLGALPSLLLLLSATESNVWMAWAGAALFGLTGQAWNTVAMSALVTGFGSQHVGRATGLVVRGFYAGFIVAPLAAGAVVDRSGDYRLAWLGAFGAVAVAAGIVSWRWLFHRESALGTVAAVSQVSGE